MRAELQSKLPNLDTMTDEQKANFLCAASDLLAYAAENPQKRVCPKALEWARRVIDDVLHAREAAKAQP